MSKEATQHKVWLQKLDAWFASQNINQILSFVAEENILPGGPTILAATTNVDQEVTIVDYTTDTFTSFVEETTNSGCPLPINVPDPLLVVDDNNPPQQESEPGKMQPQ
jgi:hypothetical protein